jgi:signal transduction histidine kinase
MDGPNASDPFGQLTFDDDSVILRVNTTLAHWLEYEPTELSGQRLDRIVEGGSRLFFQSQFLPILKLQERLEEVYLSLRTKGGQLVPMLINAVRRTGPLRPMNDLAAVRMRQRARLEDELLQARKLAEQANDAKAKFLAVMSHELRTPLQTISLSTDLMLEGECGPITEDQRERLEASRSATESLVQLVDDILNFAKMQTSEVQLQIRTVSVEEALTRAEVLLRDRLQQAGIRYRRNPLDPRLAVQGDPTRIQQVLLNLLNNALKFTPAGGTVSTAAQAERGVVHIHVVDTGIGIPESHLERIFEPFVQVGMAPSGKNSSGVGLGLAICRQLARAMGGDLQVSSRLGLGSTFTVSLPRAATPEIASSQAGSQTVEAPRS